MSIRFLHTMIRVEDIDESLRFFCDGLGLTVVERRDIEKGRFTLVFLATPADIEAAGGLPENGLLPGIPAVELTYNWDKQSYTGGRNFGHLAYEVDDIYAVCKKLSDMGVTINRPPRDGHMAFVRSPDNISVELLQKGESLAPAEPWASAENIGEW
ncbi:VOC family protein [Hirschia baltica]|uniref:Glyoxalase/bleomycin resistance protein/dioxygenase n=1 Tax=Hirschia baltica (strain ATCC 49814 / DSM 5838 / IFAM 1418) TaxID=582402 RepID=C6XII2_HIRBI|nr:VOC family protein [Hirschia baltica]ACT60789.1 Glyoxalase/bleomycin resistance protein/dioxygenase [Hirschia baltica ATCC 49814]